MIASLQQVNIKKTDEASKERESRFVKSRVTDHFSNWTLWSNENEKLNEASEKWRPPKKRSLHQLKAGEAFKKRRCITQVLKRPRYTRWFLVTSARSTRFNALINSTNWIGHSKTRSTPQLEYDASSSLFRFFIVGDVLIDLSSLE